MPVGDVPAVQPAAVPVTTKDGKFVLGEDNPQTVEQWLECLELPAYLALIPLGRIKPIVGPIIYMDGNGAAYSREDYITKWGVDPELGMQAKDAYRQAHGGGVHFTDGNVDKSYLTHLPSVLKPIRIGQYGR